MARDTVVHYWKGVGGKTECNQWLKSVSRRGELITVFFVLFTCKLCKRKRYEGDINMNAKEIAKNLAEADFMGEEDWTRIAQEMDNAAAQARKCAEAKKQGSGEYQKRMEGFFTLLDDAVKGVEMMTDEIR